MLASSTGSSSRIRPGLRIPPPRAEYSWGDRAAAETDGSCVRRFRLACAAASAQPRDEPARQTSGRSAMIRNSLAASARVAGHSRYGQSSSEARQASQSVRPRVEQEVATVRSDSAPVPERRCLRRRLRERRARRERLRRGRRTGEVMPTAPRSRAGRRHGWRRPRATPGATRSASLPRRSSTR